MITRYLEATSAAPRRVQAELRRPVAYLLPLRLFIGVGWLRTFAEKAVDAGWWNGITLQQFLTTQLDREQVAFPAYEHLIHHVFLPHALLLSWIIGVGELLAGVAILSGTLTNAALLWGLFMNLNFLLVGVPDPSAFYVVIQSTLLLGNAGAILGGDGWLSSRLRFEVMHPLFGLLIAQRRPLRIILRTQRPLFFAAALVSLGISGYALAHATDFSPAGSVHDPAMVLLVLAVTEATAALIAYLQRREPAVPDQIPAPAPKSLRLARKADLQPSAGLRVGSVAR